MYDVIVIGAGASGLMCASLVGAKKQKVLVLEHNERPGKKIIISGGGRCNFTNLHTSPLNFVSENPHFSKSALSRFLPSDFVKMVQDHHIHFHEKKLGQLFCNQSAQSILQMFLDECTKHRVEIKLSTKVNKILKENNFVIDTSQGIFETKKLVIATGGLSFPKIGASDFGYKLARQFGLKVTNLNPALDGFILNQDFDFLKELSGISIDCILRCKNGPPFRENILFTHKGISGPAALQGSLYWNHGEEIHLNILPDVEVENWLKEGKDKTIKNLMAQELPLRFCENFCNKYFPDFERISHLNLKTISQVKDQITNWKIIPAGNVGYSKAEVTKGGVDTNELSSKTMESKKVPGLYFIGEVVDVTGWLGGFNFQWAWASAYAASLDI